MNERESAKQSTGGLYKNLKMSVKTANLLVLVGVILLVGCLAFAILHAGFTVHFDTDGGSHVESIKVMHGDLISVEDPVKEGYLFTGWYTDRDCTAQWNPESDQVTDSMTLYAGWKKAAA